MELNKWLHMLTDLIESHNNVMDCTRRSSIIHYETKLARIEGKIDIVLLVIKTMLGK
jgi:hypothetical protein